MLLDKNGSRNKPNVAHEKREDVVVAAAVITINFNELSEKFKKSSAKYQHSFGKLLVIHHIKTTIKIELILLFAVIAMVALSNCKLNRRIYGRINTIVKADSKQWLARVVEILPGITKNNLDAAPSAN